MNNKIYVHKLLRSPEKKVLYIRPDRKFLPDSSYEHDGYLFIANRSIINNTNIRTYAKILASLFYDSYDREYEIIHYNDSMCKELADLIKKYSPIDFGEFEMSLQRDIIGKISQGCVLVDRKQTNKRLKIATERITINNKFVEKINRGLNSLENMKINCLPVIDQYKTNHYSHNAFNFEGFMVKSDMDATVIEAMEF